MSAAEALKQARKAGIRIGIDGNDLVLYGSGERPIQVLDLLRQHKSEILMLLRRGRDGWSGADWREFLDERAAVAEFEGGLPRDQAEAQAFSCCISEWLHRNPTRSAPGRCDHCGVSGGMLVPCLTDYSMNDPGHTWLHPDCSRTWHQARRSKAVSALELLGICLSRKVPDDLRGGSSK